jgi:hypothetical protein
MHGFGFSADVLLPHFHRGTIDSTSGSDDEFADDTGYAAGISWPTIAAKEFLLQPFPPTEAGKMGAISPLVRSNTCKLICGACSAGRGELYDQIVCLNFEPREGAN